MLHGPAGLGKAAAIGIAWLYRRLYADSARGGAVSIPTSGDWAMTSPEHLLLTSLGTQLREPPPLYALGDQERKSLFAPLALLQLLPAERRPERVIVLATAKAADTSFPRFLEEAERIGVPAERCDVPDVATTADLDRFFSAIADRLPAGCRVTLDVTHGLRHHAFLFYSLALYLRSLRGVRIEGAWYGMLETGTPTKPIIDLRPALDLAEWFHAVRLFRDTGSASALAELLDSLHAELEDAARESGEKAAYSDAGRVRAFAKRLRETSFAYASALPLELGLAAESLARVVQQDVAAGVRNRVPLAGELARHIGAAAKSVAFTERPPGPQWKERIAPTNDEFERQLRLIQQFVTRDQIPAALGAMRELIVSTVARSVDGQQDWLARGARERAERRLGALAKLSQRGGAAPLDENERWWGKLWNDLTFLRNKFLHQGMCPDEVGHPGPRIQDLLRRCEEASHRPPPTLGGGGGRLLISPQGQSPGVLFNALRAPGLEIDRCIAVCSESSRDSVQTAAERAGFSGELIPLVMLDPLRGAGEIEGLVKSAENELLRADEVVVNLTGGTTLMGVVAQALFEAARRFERSARRFLLIDARPSEEQRREPWVVSGIHWLDPDPRAKDDDTDDER